MSYGFIKSVANYRIALFFSFVLSFFYIVLWVSCSLKQDSQFPLNLCRPQERSRELGCTKSEVMFLVLAVTAQCSVGKSFNFFFSCSRYSLSCVKDDKFLFSVITVGEIMLCWQPPVPSRGLKMKDFGILMGIWGSGRR